MNLIKGSAWPIHRDGRQYWVEQRGDRFRVVPHVAGGATATTPSSQASAQASALAAYLAIAPTKFYSILGTIPNGVSGGASSNVTWQQDIPVIPAFCTSIDYELTLPVALTLEATTGAATLSPYAPYSAVANQMLIGGAPPWNLTEFTPWYIDNCQHKWDYDPAYAGVQGGYFGNVGATPSLANGILDQGPNPIVIGGSGSLNPGTTVTNTTTAAVTTDYSFTFKVRQKLQVKRNALWGSIPFGDPENRPKNNMQLFPLVGSLPEQSLFVNGTGATCVTTSQITVNAKYNLSYIDLVPPSMKNSAPPAPTVGFGLQLDTSSPSGMVAGNIFRITHRTSMLYKEIHHLIINNGLPIRPDYFGLWDDQDQQSARWSFDAQASTLGQYWDLWHDKYGRYPLFGQMTVDMEDGLFPPIPSVTPYVATMTPDQNYAAAANIPVTPAMTTAIRYPSGTTLTNAYVRVYSFGLVTVPY